MEVSAKIKAFRSSGWRLQLESRIFVNGTNQFTDIQFIPFPEQRMNKKDITVWTEKIKNQYQSELNAFIASNDNITALIRKNNILNLKNKSKTTKSLIDWILS